jgi:hypothetical protein
MYNVVDRESTVNQLFGSVLNPAKKLVPAGIGIVDILNDFRWKNSGSTSEVPSVYVVEYELAFGSWAQNIARVLSEGAKVFANKSMDPYMVMYYADPTGFRYRFPLLISDGGKIRSISNQWGAYDGITGFFRKNEKGPPSTAEKIGQFAGGLIGGMDSGVGVEDVYRYERTDPEQITITFPLYNTNTLEEAYKNYQFVSLITFQNLKTRTSFLTYVPPCLYTIKTDGCVGGFNWPVAIVSNLEIESIGTTRVINEFVEAILIPEAYKVSITFRQLLPTSSNIFLGSMGGETVDVIGTGDELKGDANSALTNLKNYLDSTK